MNEKELLKEYVSQILKEDDFGGFGGDFGGPYGMDFTGGDQSKLAKVFITPFTDVLDTAAGKGKEISTKAQTLGKVAFEAIATSLIPVLSSDFDAIFDADKQQMDKIRGQYKDVIDRTWTAIKDNDILSAAFMYAPAAMITVATARKAPVPVLNTINVLAGGKLDSFISKVKNKLKLGDEKKMLDSDSGPGLPESKKRIKPVLNEKLDIGKILTQQKIKDVIQSNPMVQRMEKEARASTRGTLEKLFDRLRKITAAKSVEDVGRILGKQPPGLEKLRQLPDNERQQIEQAIVRSVREGAKSMYVKHLQSVVKAAIEAGVPEDHPFVTDYSAALKKIQAL